MRSPLASRISIPLLRTRPSSLWLLVSAVLVFAQGGALAVDRIKADNFDNLDSGASWVIGVAPIAEEIAAWDATVTSANTSNLQTTSTWGGIRIANPGGPVGINLITGRTLTVGSTVANAVAIDLSAATQDLLIAGNGSLRINSASQSWNVAAGRSLTVNSDIGALGNTKTLTLGGTGNITINGMINPGANPLAVLVAGANVTLNNANTYGGTTTINTGTLRAGNTAALQFSTAIVNVNNGLAFGPGVTTALLGNLTGAGNVALANSDTAAVTLQVGNNNAAASYAGILSGAGSVAKLGAGTLSLTNEGNNYAGGTVLAGGALSLASNVNFARGGLGLGGVTFQGGTLTHGYSAANTLIYDAATPFTIASGQAGTIFTPNRFRFNSAVNGGGTLNVAVGSTVSRADFQNNFAAFSGNLNFTGSGTVRLGVAALATGQPLFNAAGLVTTTLSLDGALIGVQTNSGGNTVQIGALASTGATGVLGGNFIGGSVTWQIGGKNADASFGGAIANGASFTNVTKTGSGRQTFSGTSTYSGVTNVTGGTLLVSGSINGSTTLAVTGARFELGASNVVNDLAALSLAGGTIAIAGFSDAVGKLSLSTGVASTLDFGSGASLFQFAPSSDQIWNGTLNITNWSGSTFGGGTDRLFFGSDSAALTMTQIAAVQFINPEGFNPGTYAAQMLPTGELVAVPEPGAVLSLLGGVGMLLGLRRFRR